jgi:hypothetical protein
VKTTQRYAHLSDTVLMSAMEEAANAVGPMWGEGGGCQGSCRVRVVI